MIQRHRNRISTSKGRLCTNIAIGLLGTLMPAFRDRSFVSSGVFARLGRGYMSVTFNKLSIVSVVLVLLAGCSYKGDVSLAERVNKRQDLSPATVEKKGGVDICSPETGSPFHFRKDILVAGTIGVSDVARDLPGLDNLTSRRLQTHLDALGRFNVLATHDSSFESMGAGTAVRVKHLGREHESQFVVKLELEDLTTHSSTGVLPKLLGGGTKRNVGMSLYIYGTEYGSLFHSQRYEGTASGNVVGYPGSGSTVTTPWFNTDMGATVDKILKTMSMDINEKLACVPFSTEVTSVKGNNVHIGAGYLHGIRPGETLRVYRSNDVLAPDGRKKQQPSEGWIKVHTVFPNRSIASAAEDNLGIHRMDIADVVRAW